MWHMKGQAWKRLSIAAGMKQSGRSLGGGVEALLANLQAEGRHGRRPNQHASTMHAERGQQAGRLACRLGPCAKEAA